MKLRLGTRGSELALSQTRQVADQLRAHGHTVELVRIHTTGDSYGGSLTTLGTMGVFASELRVAILDGRCDAAVHSFKDLPTAPVEGLTIAGVPHRAEAGDVLYANGKTLADLSPGATVGTGSPRRVAQLRRIRPDLSYVDIRGNIATRLARVSTGDLDAVVLAAAGLGRLGHTQFVDEVLPILPAPAQGALALECASGNIGVIEALAAIDCPRSHAAAVAERAILASLGGGCAAPIAAHAEAGQLTGGVFSTDGSRALCATRAFPQEVTVSQATDIARELTNGLLADGAADITDLSARRQSRIAGLHDDTSLWGSDTPLAGRHILLPRPDGPLADGLRAAGAEVICVPVQQMRRLPVGELPSAHWIVVTSARAVGTIKLEGLTDTKFAAVGHATKAALEQTGVVVDLVPEGPASAESLAEVFPWGPGTVVLPCSQLAADTLERALAAKNWNVIRVETYTMEPVTDVPETIRNAWLAGDFDAVVITASSVGDAFADLFGWGSRARIVTIGEPSARYLRSLGVTVDAVAATADAHGIIAALGGLT